MFQYIEAPNEPKIENNESIFLAGGISNCRDWQKEMVELLSVNDNLTVFNPRRENFKVFKGSSGYLESEKQIAWEHKYLRKASQIAFWFSRETVQPMTLFELGSAFSGSAAELFVGVDLDYARYFDVVIQCKLADHTGRIAENINQLAEAVNIYNRNLFSLKNIFKKNK